MGFVDDARKKLEETVDKHGDAINDGLDKAARLADEKTKGKYSEKIEDGVAKAKNVLDDLDGKDDDLRDTRR